jgi:protein tyrosine phosphatase (PTP) superfamily phosphohydrolase (DUF442 family)
MKNETKIGPITIAGQPSAEELRDGRFETVVNIRRDDEAGNITDEALAGTGVRYTQVPFTADTVTTEDIDRIGEAVDAAKGPVLVH